MIPLFPIFKKLTLSDKSTIEEIVSNNSPYSDYNFASLWSYNIENEFLISMLYGNLVVEFRDYITQKPFYSFFGKHKLITTTKILLEKASQKNYLQELKLIPECLVTKRFQHNKYIRVEEDRDNFDYLLSVSELASLEGGKYSTQRKLINRLSRKLNDHTVIMVDLKRKVAQKQIEKVFLEWERGKEKKREETQHELLAIQRLLKYAKYLELLPIILYEKGNIPIGFLIADTNRNDCCQVHFLKYNPVYNGINHLLHNVLAKELQKRNYRYINIEQDLGIQSLRFAKEQCKPVKFLKKYKISKYLQENQI